MSLVCFYHDEMNAVTAACAVDIPTNQVNVYTVENETDVIGIFSRHEAHVVVSNTPPSVFV